MRAPRYRLHALLAGVGAALSLGGCASGDEESAGAGVAFTERSAIYLVATGGKIRQLTNESGESRGWAWAPTGVGWPS